MNTDFQFLQLVTEGAVLTVRQLSLMITRLLEKTLAGVRVRGEISNFTCAASGHWYFLLKDEVSQIRCVMFRGRNQNISFVPSDGQAVELNGVVSFYAARGELQLNVETMHKVGSGELLLAFQRLKEKLAAQGLFDSARKKIIPTYPRAVGVVSSLQAAALADVLTVLARRAPHLHIYVYPAPVQGVDAARQLAHMLDIANKRAEVDVLLLCRGGGSIEDLWAFNEEILAQAIARSALPVVVGVGHETDFTIADFVADLRAPTPSAAAELISAEREHLLHKIELAKQRLSRSLQRLLESYAQRLDSLNYRLIHPSTQLLQQRKTLTYTLYRLKTAMQMRQTHAQNILQQQQSALKVAKPKIAILDTQLENKKRRMQSVQRYLLVQQQNRWQLAKAGLEWLNPQRILARGYTVLTNQQGAVMTTPEQLYINKPFHIQFAKGKAQLIATEVKIVASDIADS